jgi:hypothetical protein
MNSKAVTDNKEKAKSKKKKEPLQIDLSKLAKLKVDDLELSGADIAAYADTLAGAKVALKAIEKTVEEAETVLKAAMMRQWCEHFATKGHMPDLRQPKGTMATFQCIQQKTAKITVDKAEDIRAKGVDLTEHKEKVSFSIRMGEASREATKEIIASLRKILGDDFENVVSEYVTVGEGFFENYAEIVRKSLGKDENLNDKMLEILRILKPTIQFTKFSSDMSESSGYDLALEFAHTSAKKKSAHKQAQREAERGKKR